MEYKYIIYEKEGNIARLTLNKPEKLNAFSFLGGEDSDEIHGAIADAAEDDDIKVLIIKGAGRAFCVGHDLSKVGFVYGMGTGQAGEKRPSQRIRLWTDKKGFHDQFLKILLHPKITIAQVHGYAIAGGLYLAMLCDFIVAAEDSQIGLTEQRLGFAGSGAPIGNLIMTVGMKRAMDLLLTGRIIDGKEAARIGLVTKAVPPDKLEEEVNALAKALALLPRDGIAIGKATRHLIYDSLGLIGDFIPVYYSHAFFTNLRWEPDEYSFFKERRDKGTKAGFKERDKRYEGLV